MALSTPATAPIPCDITSKNLNRLLNRLEQTLLSSDPAQTSTLRKSSYERSRVGSNVEYARSLLLRLEQDSPRGKSQPHRRADLQNKRILLRKLQARLEELGREGYDAVDEESSDAGSSDEDILATYAPARKDASNGVEHRGPTTEQGPKTGPSGAEQAAAAATLVSSLRARGKGQNFGLDVGKSSGSSAQTGQASPWKSKSSGVSDSTGNTTQVLEAHETEQTALTDSLLTLASALKESTLSFSDSVMASNPLVDRTAQALDKNVGGMEKASKSMGALRRMTEGKGWFARLGLWAKVGVLWVALIIVMFVMPKLRF